MGSEENQFVPHGNELTTKDQRELFNPDFTVEANLVKYSAVFPPHSPDTPLYSTKHVDALPQTQGGSGGIVVTALTTSTSPVSINGKTVMDRVPGDFEKKVFYAIVSIWVTNGKPADGVVVFSISKLIEQLGLSSGGKTYKLVKEAISRISRSTIKIEGSYVSAPDFRKDSREFSLFADCQESQARRGRKSSGGVVDTDFYRIKLNTAIVSNMIHNYSIVIQVKDYTSASSKYYRRLVDIVEFELQKGKAVGSEKVEFLLTQLSKNLPLEGDAQNVSTILKRLSTSLKELVELGGYQYDLVKVDNNAILTVYSKSYRKAIEHKKTFSETIEEYKAIHEKIYSTTLAETIYESDKAILDFMMADESEIDFGEKKYFKTVHILDVMLFQYFVKKNKKRLHDWSKNNNERGSILRIARSVLNGANPLKYPDGYKSYEERLKEHEALISKNIIETTEHNRQKNAVDEANSQASKLFRELNAVGRQAYYKRIKTEFPSLPDDLINSEKMITDTIAEDIMNANLSPSHFTALKPTDSSKMISV